MKISLLLTLAFLLSAKLSPASGPIANSDTNAAVALRPGKDIALFFAVESYAKHGHGLRDLQYPIDNAEAIAELLNKQYGFDTEVVKNPTLVDIERKLREYKDKFAKGSYPSQGQFFIFFSGHGQRELKNGYFLAADSDPSILHRTAIAYEYWREWINDIDCKHILVAIDACFSGTFDPNWYDKPLGKRPAEMSEKQKLLAEHGLYTTRWFFTSGTEVETPDQSNFAAKLLEALRSRGGDDLILTNSEIWTYLERASPRPWQNEFGKNERLSSFLFIDQQPSVPLRPADPYVTERLAQDLNAWKAARDCGTIPCYMAYLEAFSAGEFRKQAEDEIKRLDAETKRRQEDLAWEVAKTKNTVEGYEKYKIEYRDGWYAAEADRRIADFKNGYPAGFEYLSSLMVPIKGGNFQMGSYDGEDDEKPVHSASISDFFLAKHEVTVKEFRTFISNSGHRTDAEEKGSSWAFEGGKWVEKAGMNWRHDPDGNTAQDNHPVINVSWNDAVQYCKWLSKKTGKNFRLPTEAEWEYAAANGSKHTKYSWGNGSPSGRNGGSLADETGAKKYNWTRSETNIFLNYDDGYASTAPVGQFDPNDFGLYDMTGNVWEWCSDWYDAEYYKQFEGKTAHNPKGPASGTYRVCRGGSWLSNPLNCRAAARNWFTPEFRRINFGFRVAQD